MARTMTADRFAHVVASILAGDQSNGYNADARLMLAELEAELAEHEATRIGSYSAETMANMVEERDRLEARLALAEAVCESCRQQDRGYGQQYDAQALAAWRAAK